MPSPTMVQGLLGLFLRGVDPPATDLSAKIPPVQLLTSFSLRAILAARARGRGARVRVRGRKGLQEEGGRRSGEGGWNGEAAGRLRGEAETRRKTTTARGRTMAETESKRRGQ